MAIPDLARQRVLDREYARAEAEYANGNLTRSRMHWRKYAELKATRRPVVARAIERAKGSDQC